MGGGSGGHGEVGKNGNPPSRLSRVIGLADVDDAPDRRRRLEDVSTTERSRVAGGRSSDFDGERLADLEEDFVTG